MTQDHNTHTVQSAERKQLIPLAHLSDQAEEPTSLELTISPTWPSDEELGRKIVADIDAGDKAEDRALDHYISAGRILNDVKSRVPKFRAFLRTIGVSKTRAYELIKIFNGKYDEVRAKTNARKRQYRDRKAAAAADARVRSGTDMKSTTHELSANAALSKFTTAVDLLFPQMDDVTLPAALAYTRDWAGRLTA